MAPPPSTHKQPGKEGERGYLHPIQVDWEATGAHAELLRPSHETGLNPAANARAFVEWPSLAVEIGDESART